VEQSNENNDTPIELSDKERVFVTAYFECNANGTRAWLKLHPDAKYDSAKSSAAEYLTKPNVKDEIKRIWTERAMSAEEAIARMSAIAKSDVYPFIRIDDDGFVYFNFADKQAQEHLYLIKEIETKRERRIEGQGKNAEEWEGEWVRVKLHDAYAAQRDIAKMHGKLSDRLDITSKGEKLNIIQIVEHKGEA
jgi:phage terminase small subunit